MSDNEKRNILRIFNIQRFSLHDGEGIRTTIFLKGCPLKCAWCSNPESQSKEKEFLYDVDREPEIAGEDKSVAEIVEICLKDEVFYRESGGGVTFSGGEPFAQEKALLNLIKKLKEKGVNTAAETAGAVEPTVFREICCALDCVIMDIKHYDTQMHYLGTGLGNEQIIENLKWLKSNIKNYIIRIPVIPKYNNSNIDASKFAELLASIGIKIVELLPFHQFGEKKYEMLGRHYEYSGEASVKKEDLTEFGMILEKTGIAVKLR